MAPTDRQPEYLFMKLSETISSRFCVVCAFDFVGERSKHDPAPDTIDEEFTVEGDSTPARHAGKF